MLLFEVLGDSSGELIAYPGGSCLVICNDTAGEKLVLKMDEDGFGRFAKFLVSQLTDRPIGEVVIHGFRVTMAADRVLRIEGNIIPIDGPKFRGEICLPLGDDLKDLVDVMSEMNGDGYVLWSNDEGQDCLNLVISHKRGLEVNVTDPEGIVINSMRILHVPQDFIDAMEALDQLASDTVVDFELVNPWYESDFNVIRDDPHTGQTRIDISGHLAGDYESLSFLTDYETLSELEKLITDYFWG